MPLRQTLHQLQQQDQLGKLDRAKVIADWQRAVIGLLDQVRIYLATYEREGLLKIRGRRVRITEEHLGSYEIDAADIQAGPVLLLVRPVGSTVAGADGRVDIYRQGRPSEQHRIMLLRIRSSGPASEPVWHIAFPMGESTRPRRRFPEMGTLEVTPLTDGSLEEAVDFLLK